MLHVKRAFASHMQCTAGGLEAIRTTAAAVNLLAIPSFLPIDCMAIAGRTAARDSRIVIAIMGILYTRFNS